MKLFYQQVERNAKLFAALQPANTGVLCPRVGFYFIESVSYKNIGGKDVPIAKVLWKQNFGDRFLENATQEIALWPLYHKESTGPKNLNAEDLIDKIIKVDSVWHMIEVENRKMVKIHWIEFKASPQYITLQTADILAFMGKAKTLGEAYKNFEVNAGFDVENAVAEEVLRNELLLALEDQGLKHFEDPNDGSDDTGFDYDNPPEEDDLSGFDYDNPPEEGEE
ncbi:MAG: hypothetical protein EOO43_02430 [Flavobacterium sp.]|nr:MAG: hypothetical protein EOO43_02430 [Flavobacterium sp.]